MAKKKAKKKVKKKAAKKKPTKKKAGNKPAEQLTLKQKRFAELYTSDTEFFGNGVKSYAEAYNIDLTKKNGYKVAKAAASRMLTIVNLLDYMNKLLDDMGLNNVHVDKQLAFLITQNAELGVKMAAIREFNKMRQRLEGKAQQQDITVVINR